MAFERIRAWLPALAGALAVAMLLPRPVHACSCPERAGYAMWPLDGASDVPLDTPLVFARYDLTGSREAIGYRLLDETGASVALDESSRLAAAYPGCGASETVFLRPHVPLRAGAHYVWKAVEAVDPSGEFSASFTTGEQRASLATSSDASLDYLLVTASDCSEHDCLELAEALVTLQTTPTSPLWLVVASAADEHARNAYVFLPDDPKFDGSSQLSVELPLHDRCIEAALYGVDGQVLWQTRRCDPDRCARSDTATYNFCGGPPFSGIRALDIPIGSCSTSPTQPPQASAGGDGCQVFAPGAPHAVRCDLWLLALGLGLRVGRRRKLRCL